jgi:hypothetical protein
MKEKVTKSEAEALEKYMSIRGSLEKHIDFYLKSSTTWTVAYLPLVKMGFDKFVRCLINGYEVELTRKERALDYYLDSPNYVQYYLKEFADILEIKIKGVND